MVVCSVFTAATSPRSQGSTIKTVTLFTDLSARILPDTSARARINETGSSVRQNKGMESVKREVRENGTTLFPILLEGDDRSASVSERFKVGSPCSVSLAEPPPFFGVLKKVRAPLPPLGVLADCAPEAGLASIDCKEACSCGRATDVEGSPVSESMLFKRLFTLRRFLLSAFTLSSSAWTRYKFCRSWSFSSLAFSKSWAS
mmetsp:Transcript_66796/g.118247  ORF Transcript_66796/g.118247 Transcript_66796/m.118247 type:complete len:202 (-) Transcript_66796:256-861(-)